MFGRNLKYYRLKNSLTKKALAAKCGLSPMAITNYENGSRKPSMDVLKRLAEALSVRVSDFLAVRNEGLVFVHGEFRKTQELPLSVQEFIRESVEEFFSRFYTAVELLGGEVLPDSLECHAVMMSGDVEDDAKAMRCHLGLAAEGPIDDLVAVLENKGILVYVCDVDAKGFSGMNGFVNERPYIVVNGRMSPERNRSTIAHELAHLFFDWPKGMSEDEVEKTATAIAGAFLFPKSDALRELGIHRNRISNDMALVCREYGISMFLLAKRAQVSGIITNETARSFYVKASSLGWRTNEPVRIENETPSLFEQLVFRSVCEGGISIQRGAELLKTSYDEVRSNCQFREV